MTRFQSKYIAPKGLIERLFFVFSGLTYENIADIFGMSRGTVGGWRTGASVPKLSELEKVCEITGVDWQWLLTGKTSDISALVNAFFPKWPRGYSIVKQELYEEAKRISAFAGWSHDISCAERITHAVAALWRGAVEPGAPDPMADVRDRWQGQQTDNEYIEHCQKTDVPKEFLIKTRAILENIHRDFARPGYPIGNDGIATQFSHSRLTSTRTAASFPNAARSREPIAFTLEAKNIPVVGSAAADETQGSRAGFFPPDANAQFDEISLPETTAAVKIIGDSMSPVLLNGQYAFVGPEYSGSYDHPKNYEIVVAEVVVNNQDQSSSDQRWEGVYCKRIVDAGDTWVFLSINHTGTPFSVAKANCRLWPVIGVWFAGRGKPPEE